MKFNKMSTSKMKSGHDFPADFGFGGGKGVMVRPHTRSKPYAEGGAVRRTPQPERELPADALARLKSTYRTPGTSFTSENYREPLAAVNTNPTSRPNMDRARNRYSQGGSVNCAPAVHKHEKNMHPGKPLTKIK